MALREARKAAKLSVAEVTKSLGVSDATVYMWETGQMFPKTARLPEIAALYKCTVDELLAPGEEEVK